MLVLVKSGSQLKEQWKQITLVLNKKDLLKKLEIILKKIKRIRKRRKKGAELKSRALNEDVRRHMNLPRIDAIS